MASSRPPPAGVWRGARTLQGTTRTRALSDPKCFLFIMARRGGVRLGLTLVSVLPLASRLALCVVWWHIWLFVAVSTL
jgi:hypothetical protein